MEKRYFEEWRPVKDYEGLYEVSSLGRVKSLWLGKERILKLVANTNGYLRVQLYKDGKQQMKKVHRLVAEAFLENPLGLPQVNHLDEVKTNNAVSNLEWCDCKYNNNYGTAKQRIAAALTNGKLSKPVQQLTMTGELVAEYPSAREAARQNGWSQGSICDCCRGGFYRKGKWQNSHSYKGFSWRYFQ